MHAKAAAATTNMRKLQSYRVQPQEIPNKR